jgi:adenylylsulfate kinase
MVIWLTGLSGSGKTTIANGAVQELQKLGVRCELLDGDKCRQTICSGLGFSQADREENVRRIAFVARLLAQHDVVVVVAAISPYRNVRDAYRNETEGYFEVYIDAPLQICETRDPKGLYKKARAGEIEGFTGIDAPYEPPLSPDLHCHTNIELPEESIGIVLSFILGLLGDRLGRFQKSV